MRISRKQMIGNVPILRVRDYFEYLRAWHSEEFSQKSIGEYLNITEKESDLLIKELLVHEFIKKQKQKYKLTLEGCALRNAKCVMPIKKEKADLILSEFLQRVEEINENDYYLHKVTKIILFGSYINPNAVDFADIDIAFDLVKKIEDSDEFGKRNDDLVKEAYKQGKSFSNIVKRLFYSETLVLHKMKNKNRYISLHKMNDGILDIVETKQIYPLK